MGSGKGSATQPCVIRKRLGFADLADASEPVVLQSANVELAAGLLILRVTKKNVACRLHHLLAFHDAPALVAFIGEPATEPLQHGSLRLLELKEERFAVAGHQQRNTAKCSD